MQNSGIRNLHYRRQRSTVVSYFGSVDDGTHLSGRPIFAFTARES